MSRDLHPSSRGKHVASGSRPHSCYACGKWGHFAKDCPSRPVNAGLGLRSCFVCGDPGHFARDCHQRARPKSTHIGTKSPNPVKNYPRVPAKYGSAGNQPCWTPKGPPLYVRTEPWGYSFQNYERSISTTHVDEGFSHQRVSSSSHGGGKEVGENPRSCLIDRDPVVSLIQTDVVGSSGDQSVEKDCTYRISSVFSNPSDSLSAQIVEDCTYRISSVFANPSVSLSAQIGEEAAQIGEEAEKQLDEVEKQVDEGSSVPAKNNGKGGDIASKDSVTIEISSSLLSDNNESDSEEEEEEEESSDNDDEEKTMNFYRFQKWLRDFNDKTSVKEEERRDLEKKGKEGTYCGRLGDGNYTGGKSGSNNGLFGSKGPIIIEISSSSSSEDEEEWVVGKKIPLNLRVKEEKRETKDEDEDCVILDYDPFQPPTVDIKQKLHLSDHNPSSLHDEDIAVISERGQVACRDYPHSRHHCAKFPFSKSAHESCCPQCYCYVCDVVAPCEYWNGGSGHCHASDDDEKWELMRMLHRIPSVKVDPSAGSTPPYFHGRSILPFNPLDRPLYWD